MVFGESVLNDAVAIVLSRTLVSFVEARPACCYTLGTRAPLSPAAF